MLQLLLSSGSFDAAHVRLELINDGPEAIEVPMAHFGFNRGGLLNGDYFEFNEAVPYIGQELARTLDPSVCLRIEPHYSHPVTVVDLSQHYRLPASGRLRVRYNHENHISNTIAL
jgi:hypothetical protein